MPIVTIPAGYARIISGEKLTPANVEVQGNRVGAISLILHGSTKVQRRKNETTQEVGGGV